ncbi:DegV family protein [uncultured Limosilactobacillus sp.]|uniref:DegV family protein n=1 Tax=uncultured Limosilactobacillus sp. TaxID=2837629 RepID=UPI0025F8079D|nr:DegV family protein [uncultured Limosilactobacillus sp.]
MANIKLVTDSSAGLTDEEIKEYDITIVPLSVMIDDQVYVEREDITNDEFVAKMAESTNLPKTSQPPLGKFVEVFDRLGADGSQVLCIDMMASLSGTVHAAEQSATMTETDVTVIDSLTTDRALAYQLIEAAKAIKAGATMEEVVAKARETEKKTTLYLAIDNVKNLVAGGRVSKFAGTLSGVLNIKPMLKVGNGEIEIPAKVRGNKGMHKLWSQIVADMVKGPEIVAIGISHVAAGKEMEWLKAQLNEAFPDIPVLVRTTVPVIATNTGFGANCLIYYTK